MSKTLDPREQLWPIGRINKIKLVDYLADQPLDEIEVFCNISREVVKQETTQWRNLSSHSLVHNGSVFNYFYNPHGIKDPTERLMYLFEVTLYVHDENEMQTKNQVRRIRIRPAARHNRTETKHHKHHRILRQSQKGKANLNNHDRFSAGAPVPTPQAWAPPSILTTHSKILWGYHPQDPPSTRSTPYAPSCIYESSVFAVCMKDRNPPLAGAAFFAAVNEVTILPTFATSLAYSASLDSYYLLSSWSPPSAANSCYFLKL